MASGWSPLRRSWTQTLYRMPSRPCSGSEIDQIDLCLMCSSRSSLAVRRCSVWPLAIELAAAWVRVLGVEQIMDRLDDAFRLLVGGSPLAPSRQRTMRAALDWSYGLLKEPERALFRRLAVFVGGWSLEAGEAICP